VSSPASGPKTGGGGFASLAGWDQDDHAAALAAFLRSVPEGAGRYQGADALAAGAAAARHYLERSFELGSPLPGHFTGYFEPELEARATKSDQFPVPIHAQPAGGCGLARDEIGTELDPYAIAWLRDEVDRFFLQVQGSGRLSFDGGGGIRVGYAARNGHPYRSIGRMLVDQGVFTTQEMTADRLATWLRADPDRGRAVMNQNPSYVFFHVAETRATDGPVGAAGCSVTAHRSVAVDPDHHTLGSLLWVETDGVSRLCVAQDIGAAIKGPGRLDLFFGTGADAGLAAGCLNQMGRVIPLLPK